MAPFDRLYDFLLVRHLVPFFSYLTLNDTVTLKSELEITQGHSNRYHSKAWEQRCAWELDYQWERESHGNGNKTQNWEWEWEEIGNHFSGNGNYLHCHGNLFPKILCCDELIKLLVLQLNQNANVFSIVIINNQDFCYQEHIIRSTFQVNFRKST